jgi:predicted DsbA family dithiol-disulfide isomerase
MKLPNTPMCGLDGCESEELPSGATTTLVAAGCSLHLEVVSDIICPWCYVGKRRLTEALTLVASDVPVTVTWRPFELNPTMPAGGQDRREYRTRKFGSWERSRQLDAKVAAAGAEDGLTFHHDRILRTPNTFDAHRLVWIAGREGFQTQLVEDLFKAYFVEGRDVGDRAVLADVAVAAGASRVAIEAFFGGEGGTAEVRQEEEALHLLGITGVPTVLAHGRPLFSGAQRAEIMASAIRESVHANGIESA